ncbi:DNA primase, partial [bacterium]
LQTIRDRVSVVEVVGAHVSLKKAGKAWKGLCPFHGEKTPSFTVNEERGTYKCFGCGKGGNIFTFLMEMEGRSFREAAEELAKKAGVELPRQEAGPEDSKARKEREAVFEVLELVARYFRHHFLEGRAGEEARGYAQKRGISEETGALFNVGGAPAGWDNLSRYLLKKKIDLSIGERAGLLVKKENGGYYDRFRERLIFPITDATGRTVSFGGRVYSKGEPKYLNGPETEVFHKSRVLYGLFQGAKELKAANRAVLVEGYMDVVMLHEKGFRGCLATLGTALTREHVEAIRRRVDEAVLVYDGDNAGKKAMERSLPIFLGEGFPARAVVLPEGEDPDSFAAKGGDLNILVDKAKSLFDVCLDFVRKRHDFSNVEGRLAALGEVAPALWAMSDQLGKDLYIKRACETLGVEERLLRLKIAHGPVQKGEEPREEDSSRRFEPLEKAMVRLLLQDTGARVAFMNAGGEKWLENGLLKEAALFAVTRREGPDSFPVEQSPERVKEIIVELLMDETPGGFSELAVGLEKRRLKNLSDELARSMREADSSGDWEKFANLAKEKAAIDRKISNA